MTNVKTGWNDADAGQALTMRFCVAYVPVDPIRYGYHHGWEVRRYLYDKPHERAEAFTFVMTQMLAGDALCYKAMRIVCKTNPAYESYKPMVRAVRVKYGW
jgi:hypothetical protein